MLPQSFQLWLAAGSLPQEESMRSKTSVLFVLAGTAVLVLLWVGAVHAADLIYDPYGAWNGKRIYLSPARHSDAGSRGECGSTDENSLGYNLAYYATNGSYYSDAYNPTSSYRNLRARGYKVRIGRGTLQSAIDNSNAWGATLHIPMHSNADVAGQCSRTTASRFGTVIIYWHTSSGGPNLAAKLRDTVGAYSGATSPGTNDFTCYNPGHPCTTITLGELRYTVAVAAYMESEFHTWTTGYNWLTQSWQWGWRVGWAVDSHLGYPRGFTSGLGGLAADSTSPLAAYPGFGHDPERDAALFEKEEMARERQIAACMAAEGFSYWPQPSLELDGSMDPGKALALLEDHPNARYVSRLSPEGLRAYNLALYGVPDPNNPSADALHDPASPVGGGCSAEALRTVPSVYGAFNELREELDALEHAVAENPRVLAAQDLWAGCMAGRGWAVETPADLFAAVDEQAAFGAVSMDLEAELGRAQAVSADCALQTGFGATLAAVRAEQEARLVRTHRRLLNQHRRSLRGLEGGR
jgi:hypothetical protein